MPTVEPPWVLPSPRRDAEGASRLRRAGSRVLGLALLLALVGGWALAGATPLAFAGWSAAGLALLALAWRVSAGRAPRPVAEALLLAVAWLLGLELLLGTRVPRTLATGFVPHPVLLWDADALDRYPGPRRDTGEFRILCLGDSATYAVGVPPDQAWPEVLERKLEERLPGRRFRCLNHGVPAFSTYQMMAWLERRQDAVAPDLVLVASSHNDEAPAPTPDATWIGREPWLRTLRAGVGSTAVGWTLRQARWSAVTWLLRPPEAEVYSGFRVPPEDRRAALDRIRELCARTGTPLALVVMPRATTPGRYEADFRQYAAERSLPLADAAQAFRGTSGELFLLHDDIHPSAVGEAVVAQTVLDTLVRDPRLLAHPEP